MHPNPLFRTDDRAAIEALVDQVGFGTVFLTTPEGPRAARTPLVRAGDGRLRFHLARNNALSAHLGGAEALVTVDGPHGYVSPRWYEDRATVPTWDYVAIEMQGPVRRLAAPELETLLHTLIDQHEARIPGPPWRAAETGEARWASLFKGIEGFELEIRELRPTFKLSQKKTTKERGVIAAGLEANGNAALAAAMRGVGA